MPSNNSQSSTINLRNFNDDKQQQQQLQQLLLLPQQQQQQVLFDNRSNRSFLMMEPDAAHNLMDNYLDNPKSQPSHGPGLRVNESILMMTNPTHLLPPSSASTQQTPLNSASYTAMMKLNRDAQANKTYTKIVRSAFNLV